MTIRSALGPQPGSRRSALGHARGLGTTSGATEHWYWERLTALALTPLTIWFIVSFGFSILLVEPLNAIRIPGTGFKLGFWFAQQGSIYVFVLLIFVYVWRMNRLDKQHDVHEDS